MSDDNRRAPRHRHGFQALLTLPKPPVKWEIGNQEHEVIAAQTVYELALQFLPASMATIGMLRAAAIVAATYKNQAGDDVFAELFHEYYIAGQLVKTGKE